MSILCRSILSTIAAAANVGPYPVRTLGSVVFVGPWGVSADGNFVGPYAVDPHGQFVGPFEWTNDGANQWLGPYLVK